MKTQADVDKGTGRRSATMLVETRGCRSWLPILGHKGKHTPLLCKL